MKIHEVAGISEALGSWCRAKVLRFCFPWRALTALRRLGRLVFSEGLHPGNAQKSHMGKYSKARPSLAAARPHITQLRIERPEVAAGCEDQSSPRVLDRTHTHSRKMKFGQTCGQT